MIPFISLVAKCDFTGHHHAAERKLEACKGWANPRLWLVSQTMVAMRPP